MQSQENQKWDIAFLKSSLANILASAADPREDVVEYATKEDFSKLNNIQTTQSVNISSIDLALSNF